MRIAYGLLALAVVACGGSKGGGGGVVDGGAGFGFGGTGGQAGAGGGGGVAAAGGQGGSVGGGGGIAGAAGSGGIAGSAGGGGISGAGGSAGGGGTGGDPVTCAEAAQQKSYLGCEFWPTVTANQVWSIFDFAIAIVNGGSAAADVSVELGGGAVTAATVPAGQVQMFHLPWVPELKGPDSDSCGSVVPFASSVKKANGAYRVSSSVPVAVYQFNALEYQGQGGPVGKSWASCPGNQACPTALVALGCFSFSNDASLLLPTSALGSTYRVPSLQGWSLGNISPFVAITGTADGTTVTLQLPATGGVAAGGGFSATGPGGSVSFSLARGEVAQVMGTVSGDFSGMSVSATAPVQVISGMPCMQQPLGTDACDHLEEVVVPAEALGKHYLVAQPSAPLGNVVGHVVRIMGHENGTTLSYPNGAPAGAPTSVSAGQVFDLGHVKQDFEVVGSKPFAVSTFMVGGTLQDPGAVSSAKGDPSQSFVVPVEQYRQRYVFFAPGDYDVSYADVVMPQNASVTLDGAPVTATQLIGSGYAIARVPLTGGASARVLEASAPVGLQVMGFGSYTSYQYPGGANLTVLPP